MAQLDALRLAENVHRRMVDFALDDNFVRDECLTDICRSIWGGPPDAGGLISDLWVEGAFPSKASEYSLDDLVREGSFDPDLRDVLDQPAAMPRDRKLYTHQLEAIEKAQSGTDGDRPSVVVTAGTGAGKTEAFLLPILDDLYRNPPDEKHGAKCIILYPMNALVNDQVDRLYEWLKDQNRVTLFHFTSETPEDRSRADQQGVPNWKSCRMRTRQQARGLDDSHGNKLDPDSRGPTPDIVITNYSMLEYMLCRPQDAVFFGPSLRTVVLDEAHLYTGTLAAEITLLLRRLMLRCGLDPKDILQIATSATLGTGDSNELREFAAQIFSKSPSLIHVIEGESTRAKMSDAVLPEVAPTADGIAQAEWMDGPAVVERSDGTQDLACIDSDACENLKGNLETLVSRDRLAGMDAGELRPAVILHEALSAAPLIHTIEDVLWDRKHVPLEELGVELFGTNSPQSTNAAAALLQLAASARLSFGSHPLVPHRLHVLTRPTDGLTVCLNDSCSAPDSRKLTSLGAVSAEYREVCEHCDSATLALYRCDNCGEWMLAGRETGGAFIAETFKTPDTQLMSVRRSPAAWDTVHIDPSTCEIRGSTSASAVPMNKHPECPNCEAPRDDIRPFSSGTPLTISLLAETLLSEMPEFPAAGQGSNTWLPAAGRRLLAFSDSRRESARLGLLLTNQHEQQLVRSAILHAIEESPISDADTLDYWRREIARLTEARNSSPNVNLRRILENQLRQAEAELSNLTAGGSVESWAEQLSKVDTLSQILDRPSSTTHRADTWKQLKWEDNSRAVKNQAKQLLAKEFATSTGQGDTLEALGLVEVTYPGIDSLTAPSEFIGTLPIESMRQTLSGNWPGLMASLCDTLRTNRAITLGDEFDDEHDFNGIPIGLWASATDDSGPRLTRFVGARPQQHRLRFVAEILRRCGFTDESLIEQKSKELLQACFDQLRDAAQSGKLSWVETDNRQVNGGSVPAIRLVFDRLGLRRPPNLFKCRTTGRVWNRNVLGCAPNPGSFGTLEAGPPEQLDSDPRVGRRRREYRESPIFEMGLWSEEHSAQLDPRENRRLQDLFKAGVRNILSATTTLELGIDIGGLNGVLMGNVPPGKANYLQRAGRAGRRADGSSVVATFARPRPFDREVFGRVGDYLSELLRKPVVFLDRERVVRRHLNSFLLNEFFSPATSQGWTGAMDAFGTMGAVCGVPRTPRWVRGESKPQLLAGERPSTSDAFLDFLAKVKSESESAHRPRVEALLRETAIADSPSADWADLIQYAADQFSTAVNEWRDEYMRLLDAWSASQDRRQVGALWYQLFALYDLTLIEALADRQFLPHYGFPIGVQKLRVITPDENQPGKIREEDTYRLQRDSLLALREYVPGSRLLAGGKLVTSHGLLKHWTGAEIDMYLGIRGQYTWCVNEHFYYWNTPDTDQDCPICGEAAEKTLTKFMFPRHGFSGAAWDPPKWSTNVEIVGESKTEARAFTYGAAANDDYFPVHDFGNIKGLSAFYKEDGELLVYNPGQNERGFAICLQCGYADSEREYGDGRMNLPRGFEYHARLTSPKPKPPRRLLPCWSSNTAPVIRNETLAAREVTDVLLIDFSGCLGRDMKDVALVTTLGHALQLAAARMLQLDSREIGVITTPAGDRGVGLGALLYDNVPGGAGHVRELLELGRGWLERARDVLYVNAAHDARCKSACLDCLLSFDTQAASSMGLLDRRRALQALDRLLGAGGVPDIASDPIDDSDGGGETLPKSSQQLNTEERLNRARSRRRDKGRNRRP